MTSRSEGVQHDRSATFLTYDRAKADTDTLASDGGIPTAFDTETRILVVQPDARLREDIKRLLRPYESLEVPDGRQALEMMKRGGPDLVIASWELSDMEGVALLRKMKAMHPSLPIIVTSTSHSMEWPIAAFRSGARDCFPLPFDPARLRGTVEAILRIARIGQQRRCNVLSDDPGPADIEDPELKDAYTRSPLRIRRAMAFVWIHCTENLPVERIARESALSQRHFRREFKRVTGISPAEYVTRVRIAKAKKMLRTGVSVTEVTFTLGYGDLTGMERAFRRAEGCTPREYRRRHLK